MAVECVVAEDFFLRFRSGVFDDLVCRFQNLLVRWVTFFQGDGPFETATDEVAVNDTADESKPADDAEKPAADAEPAQPTTVEQTSTKEEVDVEPQPLVVPPEL